MKFHDPRLMRTHSNIGHLRNVAMHYLACPDAVDKRLRQQADAIERIQEDNRHLYGHPRRSQMDLIREDREARNR